jgi:hypothetical protein
MIMKHEIEPVASTREKAANLKRELRRTRRAQLDAEADLAREQAAVNAFRMHCRLRLDKLVDELSELRAEKQACLTRIELLRQGVDPAWLEEDEILGEGEETVEQEEDEVELILPTDTPQDKAAEKRLYRELARRFHPDLAKTAVELSYRTQMMSAVNTAYAKDDLQALYDLAGELEPGEISELAGIESVEIRRLREEILKARRGRRKAKQQLTLLRRENTARLWQRAQAIAEGGQDWWSLVQGELQEAVQRLQREVAALEKQLEGVAFEGDQASG